MKQLNKRYYIYMDILRRNIWSDIQIKIWHKSKYKKSPNQNVEVV